MFTQLSSKATRTARKIRMRVRSSSGMLFQEPFTSHPEKSLYRQLLRMPEDHGDHPVLVFHPKRLGGRAIRCRPGTRDRSSLEDLLFQQTYLPPPEVGRPSLIVDLGANVGYTVADFAFLYPNARIIGLELDSQNFVLAQENTKWCEDRVTLINAAIWSSDGYVNFEGRGEDAYHVVASTSAADAETSGYRRARSISMDSLMEQCEISRINYLKMDIEGGETELILSSNPTWLDRVDAMKIELHRVEYGDFDRALRARGFHCYPDRLHPACIVAVRRSD